MTLAHIDSHLPATPAPATGGLLAFTSVEQAFGLAERICKTNFVPTAYRGKPEETLACILYGHELGIGPMQSLNSIDIVQGSVFLRAQLVAALALSVGGSIVVDETTAERATVLVRRPGWSQPRRVEFTIGEAQKQGLAGRDMWKKDPAGMLVNRATTRAGRWYFPDVLKGMYVEGDDNDAPQASDDDTVASEPVATYAELAQQRMAQLPSTPAVEAPLKVVDVPLPLDADGEAGDDYLAWDYQAWTNAASGKVSLAEISATWKLRNFKAVAEADAETRTAIYLAIVAAGTPETAA